MPADTDMRERLERVEAKVDGLATTVGSLATKVDGLETTVGNLGMRVDGLETKVDDLTGAVARQAVHFDVRMKDLEERLGRRFQVQTEALRELLVTFADNFGGVLDGIQRELRDLNRKMDEKFSDHASLLANHDRRLRALERLERRQHPPAKPH